MQLVPDSAGVRVRLADERTAIQAQIGALNGDYHAMVAAGVDTNADDEHDPEGTTIAFERAQLGAVLEHARAQLRDVDAALTRVAEGRYFVCERCAGPIATERLDARPAARTCIDCASIR